jgi:predicted O-methyltransferase YrrM
MNYKWQNIQRRIAHIKNPIGAEIGVFQGLHARRLLENIPDLTLYLIDPWSVDAYAGTNGAASPEMIDIYQNECEKNMLKTCENLDHIAPHRFIIFPVKSLDAVNEIEDGYLDFVFIDGAHDYDSVKADIIAWLQKIKSSGWICGHDYGIFEGVNQAVDELFPDAEIDSDFTWFVRVM